MIESIRFAGLVLLLAAIVGLLVGFTALDCLVVAVVGIGLSRIGAP